MLHFVTSYMTPNKNCKPSVESAQNGLEIILNAQTFSDTSVTED